MRHNTLLHILQLARNGWARCPLPDPAYVRPGVTYRDLLPYLAMDRAADDNVLIFRLANQRNFTPDRPAHMSGRCPSPAAQPCRAIMRWWALEFEGAP
ncbi:MAG TPA: hypothetical protein VE175_01560 [Woeseiaceae bacterium]|jgi:hypothetical protein|nr:hypothetical protein [Woeseiaceae bacterium]